MSDFQPTVLSIGYGRHLFTPDNNERARMQTCAQATTALHMIIFTSRADGFVAEIVDERLTLHPTNSRSKIHMLFDAWRIARRLVRESVELPIVTTQDPFETGLLGYLLKRRFGVWLVVQEHGDEFSLSYWRRESWFNQVRYQLGKYILKQADVVRVVSHRSKVAVEKIGVTAPIRQLPVAIDLSKFHAQQPRGALPSKKTPTDEFWFLSVARFVPPKNLSLMVRSFALAHQQCPHIRLRLVGQGPERRKVERTIAQFFGQLPTAQIPIVLEEWSSDVPGLMRQADAYLLTSNYEGWGRVLIEAMVAGLPVITTDVGCAGEVLKHEQHGLIVPVDDESAVTKSIITLATDTALYAHLKHQLTTLDTTIIPGVDLEHYGEQWVETLVAA